MRISYSIILFSRKMRRHSVKIKFWGVTAALMYGIVLTACGMGGGGGNTNPNPTYTVTYDGNVGSGGSVPIDTTNYQLGQTVTVLGNTGNLVKIGYSFSGWNTQAKGSGTTYTLAQTFVGSANVAVRQVDHKSHTP
jgi:hypothetical protein